jgi:hypothetical protein
MNKRKPVTKNNVVILYDATDKKAWILNDATELLTQLGKPTDDMITKYSRNVSELTWDIFEALSNSSGATAEELGNVMYHLRVVNELSAKAVYDEQLSKLLTDSIENGDVAPRFQMQR